MKKLNYFIWVFCTIAAGLMYFAGADAATSGLVLAVGPAAATGTYTENYVSLQGINMQKFYPELVRKFGDQGMEFIGTLQALGWTDTLDVQLIQHWEDDWIWDNFKVHAQAGGGSTATLTIDSTSIDSEGNFYPSVKDLIEFPNKDALGNYIQAYVTAVGATTITVQIAMTTLGWTIPATTASQELWVVTNASGEGTGQPTPKVSTFNLYTNTFAIVKTDVAWTGSEATDTYWFDSYEGKPVNGVVNLATLEMDYRQLVAEQGMFLSGFQYEGITDSGVGVVGTQGLFPEMNSVSIQNPYTIWGISAYDTINKSLSKQYAGVVTGGFLGIDLYTTNTWALSDYLKHTAVDYTIKNMNQKIFGLGADTPGTAENDRAISIDFTCLELNKRQYGFKMFNSMNNPKTYGTTGFDYTRRGFMFPLRNDNLDVKTKAKIPSMRVMYRKKAGYSRAKEMWTTGSADVAKYGATNDIDNRMMHCRSQMGTEFFAANNFVNIKSSY